MLFITLQPRVKSYRNGLEENKYEWREFTVMTSTQIIDWVDDVSQSFGGKYMFNFYREL